MSNNPFISRDRSFEILCDAVWATVPAGDAYWTCDGRTASEEAHLWIDQIEELRIGEVSIETFTSRIEDLPWIGSNVDLAVDRFIQYETQRGVWNRYQARQRRERADHEAGTLSLGSLLEGAVRMARESRHAA